ncbi:MobC family plasmid mobilization relaxosome protein [Streptomyces sp. NRRL B-24484]|uniref:MobC family plasmid mobilization relaxosome protein n=1 Tax=Streptomyces sp. NRRL B-24484 TaxID=1463833 RepID=UPI0013318272|nr:MobC family plasmid mobilization relaxosome protein [Streptomyces sp. NRRL B-24484]
MRLSDAERVQWEAARDATGRKETGAWVRAVVTEALTGHPGLPGEPPMVPEVNHAAYLALAGVGNNLNQLTRAVHSGGLPADLLPRLEAAIEAVGNAALAVRGIGTVGANDWEPDTDSSRDESWVGPEDGPA